MNTGADLGCYGLPRGSRPYGLATSRDQTAAYASLEGSGELHKLDWNGVLLDSVALGAQARGVALPADSQRVFVSRFLSPATHGELALVGFAARVREAPGLEDPEHPRAVGEGEGARCAGIGGHRERHVLGRRGTRHEHPGVLGDGLPADEGQGC